MIWRRRSARSARPRHYSTPSAPDEARNPDDHYTGDHDDRHGLDRALGLLDRLRQFLCRVQNPLGRGDCGLELGQVNLRLLNNC